MVSDPRRRGKDVFSTALEPSSEERTGGQPPTLPDNPALAGGGTNPLSARRAEGSDEPSDRAAGGGREAGGAVEEMRLGPYRLLREIGRGGMGTVYLAVRDEPSFTQRVALKLIKRGMDTDEIVRRFVAERQILASLAHPNIARLFDGGSTPDGRPYFVMEYVEGQPITAYAEEHKLSLDARLHLFGRVCAAVQSAHQSLVVHRDLKPANILVNAQGEPKLLDFGIAKLLDPGSLGELTDLTGLAPGPMTPDYASPEQRAGGPVTTATDVYGLGVLLYELLVGQSPRSVERELGADWASRPPSQALAALTAEGGQTRRRGLRWIVSFGRSAAPAAGPRSPSEQVSARRVAGDLDTIIGKALEPEPARRYGTAAALGEDVERYLTQRPVAARRPTLAYRLSRTLVRHKLAAILVLAVCGLAVFAVLELLAARKESQQAEAQRQIAQASNELLLGVLPKANAPNPRGQGPSISQALDAGVRELLARTRYQPETRATVLEAVADIYRKLGLYPQERDSLLQALQLRESRHDGSAEALADRAKTLDALGQVSLDQEAYGDAYRFFARALALKERHLPATAPGLVGDLNGMGTASLAEGKTEEAERNFGRACQISRFESRPAELADCYNNLGTLAEKKGEYRRARIAFSFALRYFQSNLGDTDEETLLVKGNLADTHLKTGDPAGAEVLLREIVEVRRRSLSPDHPDFGQALLDFAVAQRESKHFAAAAATLSELLEIRRTYHFPRNLSEATIWDLRGGLALDARDLETADAAYAKSYEIYRSLPGDQYASLSKVLNGRARIRLLRDDPAAALDLARRSLKLAQAVGAQSGDAVPWTESVLGRCYLALGEPGLARTLLERSYQALLALHGAQHPYTRETAESLRRLGPRHG